jgi:hypothetical protein
MRPSLDKLLPALQRQTREALEKFADAEFKPDVVRIRIFDAAKEGHKALRLKLPVHLDLRKTRAAEALATWCKANALTIEWLSYETDLPDGRRGTVWEPEISW